MTIQDIDPSLSTHSEDEGAPMDENIRALLESEPNITIPLGDYSREDEDALANMRSIVSSYLTHVLGVAQASAEDAELVVSETAGNVIAHSEGHLTHMAIRKQAGRVAISIGESGTPDAVVPEHPELPPEDDEHHRGLFLVDFLTEAHGTRPVAATSEDGTGTEYWAVFNTAA